jgi:acetyl esterase/lipase
LATAAGFGQQAAPKLPDGVVLESNIAYAPYKQTLLDIVRPKEAANGKRPGVIVIHGGGWVNGTKESQLGTCLRYVEKGFVCADVEYRLAAVATAPAAVSDVLAASQWFFKNAKKYGVDTRRIVVTGGSAGGHLSLMVGMTPKSAKLGPQAKVRAVVNFYGIADVGDQLEGANLRKYAVTWVPEQPGRTELARRVSPMTYVRKGLPAILTLHGDADPTVPYEHGVKLTKALQEAGDTAVLVTVPGGKHGFPKETVEQIYERDIWPFLTKAGVL